MLGSTPITALLGAAPDPTDHEKVRNYIKVLCNEGLSVLLCYPGTKKPFDGRTVRTRNAADKAAKEEAKAAGRKGWMNARSPSGLALATTDHRPLTKKNGYLDYYLNTFGAGCDSCYDDGVETPKTCGGEGCRPKVAVNIAIEVGGSRLIVVDCDTMEQKHNFLEIAGAPEEMPPTVISPGTQADDGTWVHSDGGHYYFTLPEGVDVPVNTGAMTWGGDHGFAVLWSQRYVLIPPSVRPEGPYELVGRDYPAPDWLIEAITDHAEAKANRYVDNATPRTDDLSTAIDAWAEQVSWAEILEPLGWVQASRPDNCGCDVWTAPGVHSSPKSATAHDPGCGLNRYTDTNCPLKIWTDNPGEPFDAYIAETKHTTISKLQAVAWAHHEGNIGAAMDALDLGSAPDELERSMGLDNSRVVDASESHDPTEEIVLPERQMAPEDQDPVDAAVDEIEGVDFPGQLTKHCVECDAVFPIDQFFRDADGDAWHHSGTADAWDDHLAEDYTVPDGGYQTGSEEKNISSADDSSPFADPEGDEPPQSDVFESTIQGVPVIAPFSHWKNMPPPEFIIDGLIEHGGLSAMIGKPGVGKSAIALDMALAIATGRPWQGRKVLKTRVLYLPGEGLSGTIQRVKAWSHMHDIPHEVIDEGTRIANDIMRVGASSEAWGALCEYILRQRIEFVILDTFARMTPGIEENSATEVGKAIVRLDNLRKLTGAGAMVIHHTGKADPRVARGSSALNGALDSELLIAEASWVTYSEEDNAFTGPDGRPLPPGKAVELVTTKQKNAEQIDDPMALMMRNCETYSAPYITGPTGTIDPFDGEILFARPRPEPVVETAVRIRNYLAQFTDIQPTKAEIAAAVRPDPYTRTRTDSSKAWKQAINLALDIGMRYGLIDHPVNDNDTVLTTKFVIGGETPENARQMHAQATLNDESNGD